MAFENADFFKVHFENSEYDRNMVLHALINTF